MLKFAKINITIPVSNSKLYRPTLPQGVATMFGHEYGGNTTPITISFPLAFSTDVISLYLRFCAYIVSLLRDIQTFVQNE